MQRRSFLNSALASALGGVSSQLWAAPAPDARFLLVFLRGGYDALSLLVPAGNTFYTEIRPNIAVPLARDGQPGASALNTDWALHPSLQASLLPLTQQGQAAFVPYAGTDDTSRSHFETQDAIELGQGDNPRHDYGSGFMNRLAQQLGARNAIAFTEQLPLCLRGAAEVANVSLKSVPPLARANALPMQQALASMYQGTPLQGRVAEAFEVRNEVARDINAMAEEANTASRNAISAKGFELEARRVARLMRDRYALGFIDVGGWDTHVNQGGAKGYLASRLAEVGLGLAGFVDEIGAATWRKTNVVVVSEFGRTARENGNRGTDHGHGSTYWVLGGGLSCPPVVGEQVAFAQRSLFQNRDLPVLNEYRALLGGLFARQFGLSTAALEKVFPGARARDLGLL